MKLSGLPKHMPFERADGIRTRECFWKAVGMGTPKEGQWYVSGAVPMAYRAPKDLSSSFMIVRPTFYAEQVQQWVAGDLVRTTRGQRSL